jgi:hypothetical protein
MSHHHGDTGTSDTRAAGVDPEHQAKHLRPGDLLDDVLKGASDASPPSAEDAIPGEYPEDNPDKEGEDRFDAG